MKKFPGFGKVFAEVNKRFDINDHSVNQQCKLTYDYLKEYLTEEKMTIKKLIESYLIISSSKKLYNYEKKCRCDLSNLIHCATPKIDCEIIERNDDEN